MPLIECPDCGRQISDRAKACPDCACPVAEVVSEQRREIERKALIESRTILDRQVDCPRCEARGMYELGRGYVEWCPVCEATGRILLFQADDGYYAVAEYARALFEAGELHPSTSGVVFFLGRDAPTHFRFPEPSPRYPVEPTDIPWSIDDDPQQKAMKKPDG